MNTQELPYVFFSDQEYENVLAGNHHIVSAEETRHLRGSLRKKGTFSIALTNGRGHILPCEVTQKNEVILIDKEFIMEKSKKIRLISPLIKKKGLQFLLQKCTETGVDEFHFISSSFDNSREFSQSRLDKIVLEACKQSKNPFLPKVIIQNTPLRELYISEKDFTFWGMPGAEKNLFSFEEQIKRMQTCNFINGPEGGWSPAEENYLKNRFPIVNLSKNVLRAETAAISAMYHLSLYVNVIQKKR